MTDTVATDSSSPGFAPDERFDTLATFFTSQKLWEGALLPLLGITNHEGGWHPQSHIGETRQAVRLASHRFVTDFM